MEYRAHTSCVSEAQKYQGALYKENGKSKNSKAAKAQKKGNSQALVPRQPYVEDAPDPDAGTIAIVDAPPHAPSPPPPAYAVLEHQPEQLALPAVNVFDFLVTDDTPNASRVSLPPPPPPLPPLQREQQHYEEVMTMVENAPTLFAINRSSPLALNGEDGAMILQEYEEKMYESDRQQENGYQDSYRDNASIHSMQAQSQDRAQEKRERLQQRPQQQPVYLTPAPKREREASKQRDGSRGREHKSKDGKKRKRHHAEDLDLTTAGPSHDRDLVMAEAPTLHSGLTGGMEKMFSRRSGAEYPSPSPDYPDDIPVAETPASPLKRTRHSRTESRPEPRPEPRGRDKRVRGSLLLSLVSSGTSRVSTRKSSSSTQHTTSDDRPPKKHHRHRRREDSERPHQRNVKAIEYHPTVEPGDSQNQLVVYRTRAELFTSFISKGPESTLGCSMNKALKRYHRERADQDIGMGRAEEEKELWKSLRMKKNDRGEIVLFF
ncbi:MAG: hypothetical protein M1840_001050 [Geoglossum simile]|nr:MAG: hypothetical protein M1840_001050 [Geoglossum simile]